MELSGGFLTALSETHYWLFLGVALGIAEMLTVSFWALPFALGAWVTAVGAYFELPMAWQLGLFAFSSLVALFVIQMVVRRYLTSREASALRTNADAMIGREALVLDVIDGTLKAGAVKVGGERWSAFADQGQRFEPGDVVVIAQVGGASVRVSSRP